MGSPVDFVRQESYGLCLPASTVTETAGSEWATIHPLAQINATPSGRICLEHGRGKVSETAPVMLRELSARAARPRENLFTARRW
jgi:hypothetical protein